MIRFFKRIREFYRRIKLYFAVKNSDRCMCCSKYATTIIKDGRYSVRACADHAEVGKKFVEACSDIQYAKDTKALASLKQT